MSRSGITILVLFGLTVVTHLMSMLVLYWSFGEPVAATAASGAFIPVALWLALLLAQRTIADNERRIRYLEEQNQNLKFRNTVR